VLIEQAQPPADQRLTSLFDALGNHSSGVRAAGRSVLLRAGCVTVSGSTSALVGQSATGEPCVSEPSPTVVASDVARSGSGDQGNFPAREARIEPSASDPKLSALGGTGTRLPLKSAVRGIVAQLNRARGFMLGGLEKISRTGSGRDGKQ